MARTPRLSPADLADLAARHKIVSARIMAAENIARHTLRAPIADATRHLIARVAGGAADAASVKRSVFGGVRALQDALSHVATSAVETARTHARALASGQAQSDLGTFVARAHEFGIPARAPDAAGHLLRSGARVAAADQDAAIARQAALSLTHRWSSQSLGTYSRWHRSGAGTDALVRSLEAAGGTERGPLADLVETQAITQSVDAYADQHALVWDGIASAAASVDALASTAAGDGDTQPDPETAWLNGMFDVWSAILDRGTCSVCAALDGDMVKLGDVRPGGRPPAHPRCRCAEVSIWVPDAAIKSLEGAKLDYSLLKEDIRQYAKGSTLDIGEGRRHAREFYEAALASDSRTALADALSNRRAYFPLMSQPRAPRLLF